MKKPGIILLTLFYSFQAISQQRQILQTSTDLYPTGGTIINDTDVPLILIGSLETNAPSLIMNQDNLRVLVTYREPHELKHFGEKGNYGIMVAELKTKIPLLRLDEVLDYFKVPAAHRQLKVLVDKNLINPELFLADVKKIQKIEVFEVTQEDVIMSLIYNRWVIGDRYLNIVTVPD